jgi:putative salt-induced outer membrane protein YdiY
MEHPLVNDIDNLTAEELQSKISYLLNKYNWAVRNNAQLANQVLMVLHSYQTKYQEKQQALLKKSEDSGQDFSDRIDIS